jgi:hypothetical protein
VFEEYIVGREAYLTCFFFFLFKTEEVRHSITKSVDIFTFFFLSVFHLGDLFLLGRLLLTLEMIFLTTLWLGPVGTTLLWWGKEVSVVDI